MNADGAMSPVTRAARRKREDAIRRQGPVEEVLLVTMPACSTGTVRGNKRPKVRRGSTRAARPPTRSGNSGSGSTNSPTSR